MMASAPAITVTVTHTTHGVHLHMVHELAHDTVSLDCWCAPTYYRPCDECGDRSVVDTVMLAPKPPGCWKCEHSLIRLTADEARVADVPLVIVHR